MNDDELATIFRELIPKGHGGLVVLPMASQEDKFHASFNNQGKHIEGTCSNEGIQWYV